MATDRSMWSRTSRASVLPPTLPKKGLTCPRVAGSAGKCGHMSPVISKRHGGADRTVQHHDISCLGLPRKKTPLAESHRGCVGPVRRTQSRTQGLTALKVRRRRDLRNRYVARSWSGQRYVVPAYVVPFSLPNLPLVREVEAKA